MFFPIHVKRITIILKVKFLCFFNCHLIHPFRMLPKIFPCNARELYCVLLYQTRKTSFARLGKRGFYMSAR